MSTAALSDLERGHLFLATWTEGEPVGGGRSPVGRDATPVRSGEGSMPEAISASFPSVWRSCRPTDDPVTLAALATAKAEGLPYVYAADGLTFGAATPLLLEHADPPVGWCHTITRTGERSFMAQGYVAPEYADLMSACGSVSPGLWIERAEVVRLGLAAVHVTRSALIELSATPTPARRQTSLIVSPTEEAIPTRERFATIKAGDTIRFVTDDADRRLTAAMAEREALIAAGKRP